MRHLLTILSLVIGLTAMAQTYVDSGMIALIKKEDLEREQTGQACDLEGRTFQQKSFEEMMDYALTLHDTASSKETEEKALAYAVQTVRSYPKEWIAHYWTAHLYGQVGRLFDDNDQFVDYMKKAHEHMRKAWEYCDVPTMEDESELLTLESLLNRMSGFTLYNPRRDIDIDKAKADKYVAKAQELLVKAENKNPNNPRVHLQKGITSAYTGQFEQGIEQLEYALELYEQYPAPHKIYPNWGKGWISVWLPRAQKMAAQSKKP